MSYFGQQGFQSNGYPIQWVTPSRVYNFSGLVPSIGYTIQTVTPDNESLLRGVIPSMGNSLHQGIPFKELLPLMG